MREPSKKDLLAEIDRLKAENERLNRLVKTQRPELRKLRDVEVALRYELQHADNLRRIHERLKALLQGDDDLPGVQEVFGIMGPGKARVDAAIQRHGEAQPAANTPPEDQPGESKS